jgi:hypothetical protein
VCFFVVFQRSTEQGERTIVESVAHYDNLDVADVIPHVAARAQSWRDVDASALDMCTDIDGCTVVPLCKIVSIKWGRSGFTIDAFRGDVVFRLSVQSSLGSNSFKTWCAARSLHTKASRNAMIGFRIDPSDQFTLARPADKNRTVSSRMAVDSQRVRGSGGNAAAGALDNEDVLLELSETAAAAAAAPLKQRKALPPTPQHVSAYAVETVSTSAPTTSGNEPPAPLTVIPINDSEDEHDESTDDTPDGTVRSQYNKLPLLKQRPPAAPLVSSAGAPVATETFTKFVPALNLSPRDAGYIEVKFPLEAMTIAESAAKAASSAATNAPTNDDNTTTTTTATTTTTTSTSPRPDQDDDDPLPELPGVPELTLPELPIEPVAIAAGSPRAVVPSPRRALPVPHARLSPTVSRNASESNDSPRTHEDDDAPSNYVSMPADAAAALEMANASSVSSSPPAVASPMLASSPPPATTNYASVPLTGIVQSKNTGYAIVPFDPNATSASTGVQAGSFATLGAFGNVRTSTKSRTQTQYSGMPTNHQHHFAAASTGGGSPVKQSAASNYDSGSLVRMRQDELSLLCPSCSRTLTGSLTDQRMHIADCAAKTALRKHEQTVQLRAAARAHGATMAFLFVCNICGNSYQFDCDLQLHVQKRHAHVEHALLQRSVTSPRLKK